MGLFYPPDSTGENKANAPVSGNTGATYNAVTLLFSFCAFTYHGNTGQHFGDRQPQQKPSEKIFDIGAAQGVRQCLKSDAHNDENNAGQHDFLLFQFLCSSQQIKDLFLIIHTNTFIVGFLAVHEFRNRNI